MASRSRGVARPLILVGGRLDAKPETVRRWENGDWAGYEDESGAGSDGGRDTRIAFIAPNTGWDRRAYEVPGIGLGIVESPVPCRTRSLPC